MALNTFKCNYLKPLHFKGLNEEGRQYGLQLSIDNTKIGGTWKQYSLKANFSRRK